MKNNDERIIKFYRFSLEESMKIDGVAFTKFINLDEVLAELVRDVGRCKEYGVDDKKQCFTLKQIVENDKGWDLLINVVQTGVKEPVKNKIDGSNPVPLELDDENGLEKSAHIHIQKITGANYKLGCLTLLEQIEGLSVRNIEKVLNALIRDNAILSSRRKPNPAAPDAKKDYKCNYKLVVEAVVSGDMFQEIARGTLINTTIITHDTDSISQYDPQNDPEVKKSTLSMESFDSTDAGAIANFANKIRQFARKVGGASYKFEYKDISGATHTATLSSDTGNLIDGSLFVHKVKITELINANKDAYTAINAEIMNKMKGCL